MKCKRCESDKDTTDFYKNDKTCKPCRREMVKANRESKADYYRNYDKKRYKNDPRVRERHRSYVKSDAGKIAVARARKKYIERNPIKRAVHVITGNAIRDGRIIKNPCEVCGSKDVHAHHDDYSYPMSVRWLCAKHHKQWHEENGEGLNAT